MATLCHLVECKPFKLHICSLVTDKKVKNKFVIKIVLKIQLLFCITFITYAQHNMQNVKSFIVWLHDKCHLFVSPATQ